MGRYSREPENAAKCELVSVLCGMGGNVHICSVQGPGVRPPSSFQEHARDGAGYKGYALTESP